MVDMTGGREDLPDEKNLLSRPGKRRSKRFFFLEHLESRPAVGKNPPRKTAAKTETPKRDGAEVFGVNRVVRGPTRPKAAKPVARTELSKMPVSPAPEPEPVMPPPRRRRRKRALLAWGGLVATAGAVMAAPLLIEPETTLPPNALASVVPALERGDLRDLQHLATFAGEPRPIAPDVSRTAVVKIPLRPEQVALPRDPAFAPGFARSQTAGPNISQATEPQEIRVAALQNVGRMLAAMRFGAPLVAFGEDLPPIPKRGDSAILPYASDTPWSGSQAPGVVRAQSQVAGLNASSEGKAVAVPSELAAQSPPQRIAALDPASAAEQLPLTDALGGRRVPAVLTRPSQPVAADVRGVADVIVPGSQTASDTVPAPTLQLAMRADGPVPPVNDSQAPTLEAKPAPGLPGQPKSEAKPKPELMPKLDRKPKAEAKAKPKAANPTPARLAGKPRLVIHYYGTRNMPRARRIARSVSGVQVILRPVNFHISRDNLRYYHSQDRALAARLRRMFPSEARRAQMRDFTRYGKLPTPGLVEVWLAD